MTLQLTHHNHHITHPPKQTTSHAIKICTKHSRAKKPSPSSQHRNQHLLHPRNFIQQTRNPEIMILRQSIEFVFAVDCDDGNAGAVGCGVEGDFGFD